MCSHQRVWLDDMLARHFGHPESCRGGAGQKLPWESSRSVKGVSLIFEIKSEEQILQMVVSDALCQDSKGYSMTLMSSWSLDLLSPLYKPANCTTCYVGFVQLPAPTQNTLFVEDPIAVRREFLSFLS